MIRIVALMAGIAAAAGLHAEPATARYAPVQLQVAQKALDRAERLLRRGEEDAARRLATRAALDARLAWAMTDSAFLREQAAELYLSASSLKEDHP
jgi:hypothetical protein